MEEYGNKNKFKILCIDDDPLSHTVLNSTLENQYEIINCFDGREGIELAQKTKTDLILLDITMPDMDGFAVIEILKANPATSEIPVVFVSSLDDEFNEEAGLTSGAVDYIIKPVRPGVLKARIGNLLKYNTPASGSQVRTRKSEKNFYLKPMQIEGLIQSLDYVLKEKELFLREDLRAAHVAQAIGIRSHHLQELLNTHLKISFTELIKKTRIDYAISIMKENPDEKIINIIYDSGFQTKSAFNQAFKEITGLSPTDYKKKQLLLGAPDERSENR